MKGKCEYCEKFKLIKGYVIADDMEKIRRICKKCWQNLQYEVMRRLNEVK